MEYIIKTGSVFGIVGSNLLGGGECWGAYSV